jgi:hypothetical protein
MFVLYILIHLPSGPPSNAPASCFHNARYSLRDRRIMSPPSQRPHHTLGSLNHADPTPNQVHNSRDQHSRLGTRSHQTKIAQDAVVQEENGQPTSPQLGNEEARSTPARCPTSALCGHDRHLSRYYQGSHQTASSPPASLGSSESFNLYWRSVFDAQKPRPSPDGRLIGLGEA